MVQSVQADRSGRETIAKWQTQPPTWDEKRGIEYSVHRIPPRFVKELARVFVGIDLTTGLVISTFLPTRVNMVSLGGASEAEKDECLDKFFAWGSALCDALEACGYWADMADPTSGYAMRGQSGPSFYPEVYGVQYLLGYDLVNAGCCKVVNHPRWGTKVYPASLFTTAPAAVLAACLAELSS